MIDFRACYTPERITELWRGRPALSLREILALDIPAADKIWVVFCPHVLTLAQIDRVFSLFEKRNAYARADARAYARACADEVTDVLTILAEDGE